GGGVRRGRRRGDPDPRADRARPGGLGGSRAAGRQPDRLLQRDRRLLPRPCATDIRRARARCGAVHTVPGRDPVRPGPQSADRVDLRAPDRLAVLGGPDRRGAAGARPHLPARQALGVPQGALAALPPAAARGRRGPEPPQTGLTSTIFFLPAASLTTPSTRSAEVTRRLASGSALSLTRSPPPWARRRASEREDASPASAASVASGIPASSSARGTSMVGRSADSAPCSKAFSAASRAVRAASAPCSRVVVSSASRFLASLISAP